MHAITKEIISVLRLICPDRLATYPTHEPTFVGNELKYVSQCIESGWVSYLGSYVTELEKKLAAFTGAQYAVVLSTGTSALHLALRACGVCEGEEVLLPSLTFVATANAVAYCGASPHFLDCEEEHLGICPQKLSAHLETIAVSRNGSTYNKQTGKRISALVPVHLFGHPCRIKELSEIADRFNLYMVEDAAESLGSRSAGRHTGTWGRMGAISFNGNKIVTTGGGGAVITDDKQLADKVFHLSRTAKTVKGWELSHDEIGYNCAMPNINAALGCAQLERIDSLIAAKRKLALKYAELFAHIAGVRFVVEPADSVSNYWLCTAVLDPPRQELRDEILSATNEEGIKTRPAWAPLHTLPSYSQAPRAELSATERLYKGIINLPSSAHLLSS